MIDKSLQRNSACTRREVVEVRVSLHAWHFSGVNLGANRMNAQKGQRSLHLCDTLRTTIVSKLHPSLCSEQQCSVFFWVPVLPIRYIKLLFERSATIPVNEARRRLCLDGHLPLLPLIYILAGSNSTCHLKCDHVLE